jgi:hypothetical protein
MLHNTKKLPSLEDFKTEAKQLKIAENIDKLGQAQNLLAKKYGFMDYNAIKPKLSSKDLSVSTLSKKITTYKISTGAIVNSQGLYKTKDGYVTYATVSKNYIHKFEIEKALYFIDNILEQRKTINYNSSSYGLKHYAEDFINHYKLFNRDSYISNGAFIIALDIRGYTIKESNQKGWNYSQNIYTNFKSFKGVFDQKLNNGDFDYIMEHKPYFTNKEELEKNNFFDAENIQSYYFSILENKTFAEYLSIFIYHMAKAMSFEKQNKFFIRIKKEELEEEFSYLIYDNKLTLKMIIKDTMLANTLLGISFNVIYDDTNNEFIIYWNKDENLKIGIPKNYTTKAYLNYDTFFHKFDNDNKLEDYGTIQHMDNNNIYVTYDNLDDKIYTIPLNNLENFIFYPSKKFRERTHILVNEASKLEFHQFFPQNKKGYLLAKEFMFNNEKLANFILEKICGYNLNTI